MKTIILLGMLMVVCVAFASDVNHILPEQVEVEVRFIEVDREDLVKFKDDKEIIRNVNDFMHALSSRKNTDLLSAPKVVTHLGAQATIKVVVEYIYPTRYDFVTVTITNTSGVAVAQRKEFVPSDFATREVGVILNVTPTWDSKRKMIDLDVDASVVGEPIWKKYIIPYADDKGKQHEYIVEQPFFPVRRVTSFVSMPHDSSMIIGEISTRGTEIVKGGLFRKDKEVVKERTLFVIATAKLVSKYDRVLNSAHEIHE